MSDPHSPSSPKLLGQLLLARLDYLAQLAADAREQVLLRLPQEDRDRLKRIERNAWYPLDSLLRLDRAIAAVVAPDDPAIYERLGAASARHRTEWLGADAALVNVHGYLSRVADEHRRFQNFGRAAYRREAFGEGELSFSDYPRPDEIYCRSAVGYLRRAVELLTGAPVIVEELRCQCRGDPACVLRIQWTPRGGSGPAAA